MLTMRKEGGEIMDVDSVDRMVCYVIIAFAVVLVSAVIVWWFHGRKI